MVLICLLFACLLCVFCVVASNSKKSLLSRVVTKNPSCHRWLRSWSGSIRKGVPVGNPSIEEEARLQTKSVPVFLSEHGFWIDCTNRKTVLIDNQILHRQEEWIANAFRWSGKQYLMCPANAVPRYEFGRRPTSVAGLNRIDVRRKNVFVFVLDDTYKQPWTLGNHDGFGAQQRGACIVSSGVSGNKCGFRTTHSHLNAQIGCLNLQLRDGNGVFHQFRLRLNRSQGLSGGLRVAGVSVPTVFNLFFQKVGLSLDGSHSQPRDEHISCRDVYDDPLRGEKPFPRFFFGLSLMAIGYWLGANSWYRFLDHNARWWDWLRIAMGLACWCAGFCRYSHGPPVATQAGVRKERWIPAKI